MTELPPSVESPTETEPPAYTVRAATSQDIESLLPIELKLVADSVFAGKVPLHEENVRAAMLRCIASGAGSGVLFLAETEKPLPGRPYESGKLIVGALLGEMRSVWHSRQPVAEHLGGFAPDALCASMLCDAFRGWARDRQHASCALIEGAVEVL